ncbi:MAG: hypothetical protein MUE40_17145, partial [Anaerolineae bacterium]|nr:hypothetical protein [Anaerolineae bacterium]
MSSICKTFILLCLLSLTLTGLAQDAPPLPTAEAAATTPTLAITPPETITAAPPVLTTEAPLAVTELPPTADITAVPDMPATTAEPTATVEVTAEVTAAPATPAPATVTVESIPAPLPLPLLFSADFDAGFPVELSAGEGWLSVATETGQALQSGPEAAETLYSAATVLDTEITARVLLNTGSFRLIARHSAAGSYAVDLSAAGTLTLLKNGQPLNTAPITLTPGTWITLKLVAIGSDLTVLV